MRAEIKQRVEMIRKGDVPEGYKQTKVGIIPVEWEVGKIKDFGKVITGSTPPTKDSSYYNGDFPWVTPTDINGEKYIESTLKQLTKKGLEKSRVLPKNSVLVTCIASIGKNCILKTKGSCNQQINAIVVNLKNNFEFLYYMISHNTDKMKVFAGQTATQIINKTTFEKFTIASPQLNEQTAIANILSTADKAIETTETLITLKEQKKKWLMQNLLTGKVRLPEYDNCPVPAQERIRMINERKVPEGYKQTKVGIIPGDWEIVKVSDIAKLGRGRVISTKEINRAIQKKYPVYSSQTSNNGIMGYIDTYDFEGNYITWTTDGANAGKVFNRSGRFNCTNVCGTISLKKGHYKYISSILDENTKHYVSRNLANPKLMNNTMKSIILSFPPLPEQTAIANILTTADKEIDLLNQKLDSLKQKKKALMQLLLTGIVRTTGLNLSSETEEEGVAYAGK